MHMYNVYDLVLFKKPHFLKNNIQYKYCFIIIEHMLDTVTMYSSYPVYSSSFTCSNEIIYKYWQKWCKKAPVS